MSCCDVVWSADRRKQLPAWEGRIPPGSLVYAKRDHAGSLFSRLAWTRSRVVLITGESDDPVGRQDFDQRPPQIAEWFSTNACDPRVDAIPLGLGNSYCPVTAKAADIAAVLEQCPAHERWLYVNFRPETNPSERGPLLDHFLRLGQTGDWLTVRRGDLKPTECLSEMAGHRFVLCPPGNGIDTHRMWEALYMGTIPVVQRHPALEAFADLPILFVDDLSIPDQRSLEREFARLTSGAWNLDKLFLPWWQERLGVARSNLQRSSARISWLCWLRWRTKGIFSKIPRCRGTKCE